MDFLHQDDLKDRMISSNSSNLAGAKIIVGKGIEVILSSKQQRRHLPSLLYKSFFYDLYYVCGSCTGWQLAVNEGYTELPTQTVGDFLGGTFIDNPKVNHNIF